MTRFFQYLFLLSASFLLVSAAQATLIDVGGGFIYDSDQNITWTQNANIAGTDTWANQVAWADSLSLFDSVRNVTWDDWRLPTTTQPDASCSDQFGGLPLGFGTGCTGSEMGHLFYVDGISFALPGLFTNVQSDSNYWSGTESSPTGAWTFNFDAGFQIGFDKDSISTVSYAWAQFRPVQGQCD